MTESAAQFKALNIGDCVMVSSLRATGVVTGFSTEPIPGVRVKLHRLVNGIDNCTASYRECEVVTRAKATAP